MKAKTETIQATVLEDTYLKALAFNYARNGSLHNSINELINAGLNAKLAEAPLNFHKRYDAHLHTMRLERAS